MDLDTENSNSGQKSITAEKPWIPVTPVKVSSKEPPPEFLFRRDNHLSHENWVTTEADFEPNTEMSVWEKALIGKFPVSGKNVAGKDADAGWSKIPFVNLLLATQDLPSGSKPFNGCTFPPQFTQGEAPIPCHGTYDLNMLPETTDSSLSAASIATTDNQNPVKESGNQVNIELNTTPPQKQVRRRKHRPKVVTEGKPKRVRKPVIPKPDASSMENLTDKRKYVRKNGLNKQAEDNSDQNLIEKTTTRSARRSLNFDPEPQEKSFFSFSKSTVEISQITEELTKGKATSEVAYDMVCSINKQLKEYISSHIDSINTNITHENINIMNSESAKKRQWSRVHGDLDFYEAFKGKNFPEIYKKKRTEKGQTSNASISAPSTKTEAIQVIKMNGVDDSFECMMALREKERFSKKRSKGPIRVRRLTGVAENNWAANFPGKQTLFTDPNQEVIKNQVLSVDAISERLKRLDINTTKSFVLAQECNELVPYNTRYQSKSAFVVPYQARNQQEKNTLVVYRREGTVVPFEGSFYAMKKKRPRPKVNLDDETNRVWKLLLENIDNEGINGSDEQSERWWEDERRVFQDRANSFISRMHLVQGDRRFSKWKGSVLDSVIGVFLTQNVSDHLSSSAFMSLVAQFPHKQKINVQQFYEKETIIIVEEPEPCVLDLEDTLKCKDPGEKEENEIVNINESIESTICSLSSNDDSKSTQQLIREKEDVVSPQSSVGSSLPQTEEKIAGTKSTIFDGPDSFMNLLHSFDQIYNPENCVGQSDKKSKVIFEENVVNNVPECPNATRDTTPSNNCSTDSDITESTSAFNMTGAEKNNQSSPKKTLNDIIVNNLGENTRKGVKDKCKDFDWDSLRKNAQANGVRERTCNTMDSLDWEAVRRADVGEVADTIKARGMNNKLAERIKDFLDRLVTEHESLDLEWLRDVPPDKAKEFLLSVRGLGLKSVECVRLLTLHHLAFPVDTNVGRIAVRLGWVPLQPLPESLQLHLLELYPVLESIQKYLWPRLCKLDQKTLYELHYQMITFGKVFCTKSKPNCNACPMRGECRHFASAFASARLALPAPEEKSIVTTAENIATTDLNPTINTSTLQLPPPQVTPESADNNQSEAKYEQNSNEPIIEEPKTPELEHTIQISESDIEDIEDMCFYEDHDEIPTIKLNLTEFTQTLQDYMQNNMELQEGEMSRALVALTPQAASIPTPKLKNISRLRTEHQVYELPDSHPLLQEMDKREPDDPSSYLLAIWTPGETINSIKLPEESCSSQENGELCDEPTCFSCNSTRESNSQIVRGTLLIPCRTAMRGSFPLNGTYFQVNEVFADHASSLKPIEVPRAWIWNLPRRTVYFGTSIPTIFKGLTTEGIQYCFWRGFVCVRGFDQKTRAPRPLIARLHFPASKLRGNRTNEE